MERITELIKKEPTIRPDNWNQIRDIILQRDDFKCVKCNKQGLEIDHIIPVALGGTNEISNLQTLCSRCHREKTNKDVEKIAKVKKEKKFRTRFKIKEKKQ